MFLCFSRLRAVSLFSWFVEKNARDTQMTTRVTEGARRERHEKRESLFSLLGLQRSRARALPLLNLKKRRDCSQSNVFPLFLPFSITVNLKLLYCVSNFNWLRVDFQCRVIFTCVRACVKFYVRKWNRGNAWKVARKRKSWTSLNFSFKLSNFYLASILLTWLKFMCVNVRSQKRVSGNQP